MPIGVAICFGPAMIVGLLFNKSNPDVPEEKEAAKADAKPAAH